MYWCLFSVLVESVDMVILCELGWQRTAWDPMIQWAFLIKSQSTDKNIMPLENALQGQDQIKVVHS